MKHGLRALSVIAFAGLTFCAGDALAQSYAFSFLGTLGGTNSGASAINNFGQVVGAASTNGDAATHAVLWNGLKITDLGTLGGTNSGAGAINDSGQVLGSSLISGDAVMHYALWNGTTPTDLEVSASYGARSLIRINNSGQIVGWSTTSVGTPQRTTVWNGATTTILGADNSWGFGINDLGQVVGGSNTDASTFQATLWNGTTRTLLGTLGGPNRHSYAYGINNSGQVAGALNISGVRVDAMMWDGTTEINLGALGGYQDSMAWAINNSGQIVGSGTSPGNNLSHAVLWNSTAVIDLNSFLDASSVNEGWVLTWASGINDQGSIVGEAVHSSTGQHLGFVLAPVPEPETYAMLLAGLGLIGATARRRHSDKALVAKS